MRSPRPWICSNQKAHHDKATERSELGGTQQGRVAMLELLRPIQLADASIPLAKQTPEQRTLASRKTDLGSLAERPQIYGRTRIKPARNMSLAVSSGH